MLDLLSCQIILAGVVPPVRFLVPRNVMIDAAATGEPGHRWRKHARRRAASKRDGCLTRVTLDDRVATQPAADVDLLALEQALDELGTLDAGKARLVELRFFAGLSLDETAELLGTSAATVSREWRMARSWLFARLGGAARHAP